MLFLSLDNDTFVNSFSVEPRVVILASVTVSCTVVFLIDYPVIPV